jgi:hypothetical protein
MPQPNTTTSVQTEATNIAMVVETNLNSKNPPTTGWYNLDPNSYGELASAFKKEARNAITQNMQSQKSMLTDMDSGATVEMDVTKDNLDRFGESIMRSRWKHCGNKQKSQYQILGITSTGVTVAALGDIAARFLVCLRGLDDDENVGLFMVGAGSTNTETKVAGLTVDASPHSNAQMEIAGYRGATSDLWFDAAGNLNSSGAVNFTTWNVQDFQALYFGGEANANRFDTPEFYGVAFIQRNGVSATKIELERHSWDIEARAFLDLADVAVQLDTVVEAILAGAAGNSITVASTASGTPAAKAELDMNAAGNSVHIDTIVRAKLGGTAGNLITVEVTTGAPTAAGVLTEIGTHVKIQIKTTVTATTVADVEALITGGSTLLEVKTPGTGATSLDATDAFDSVPLAGGTAATAASVTEVGDAVTLHYTSGATTVAELEAAIATSTKIRVKREGTEAAVLLVGDDDFAATNLAGGNSGADAGTGKNIDVYFTKYIRNVARNHADFYKPSICFEMTYPDMDDGLTYYEYLLGNFIDEWKWNIPQTSKATISAKFVGTRTLDMTSTRKTGPADALDPVTQVGASTATDLQRLRLDNIDETGITTDLSTLSITNNNNVSPEKQLARLGAGIINHGDHTVKWEADVIFTNPDVVAAVKDNRTTRFDVLMRTDEFGACVDIRSMTLDTAGRKMERNKSIKIGSMGMGFQDRKSGSTTGLSMFSYLPRLPAYDAE